jgi:hypothetical protein
MHDIHCSSKNNIICSHPRACGKLSTVNAALFPQPAGWLAGWLAGCPARPWPGPPCLLYVHTVRTGRPTPAILYITCMHRRDQEHMCWRPPVLSPPLSKRQPSGITRLLPAQAWACSQTSAG